MWAYLAKKGLYTLTPTFPDFIVNVGFTIEARKDDEMPGECVLLDKLSVHAFPSISLTICSTVFTEVLLGGCRFLNLDPEQAVVDGVDDVEI